MKSFLEIYESIVLEAMSLEDIWRTYYRGKEGIFTDFASFSLLNDIDPTSFINKKGKYLDWLVKHAYKYNKNIWEDKNRIKKDLVIFDKYQKKIGKQITQIKDQYELSELVEEFKEKKDFKEIDLSKIRKDAEKLYEDSDWILITPKTEEASNYYGRDTEWCTAKEDEEHNRFEYYNEDGPLYIIINKNNPKDKYQFHFQSQQYMNTKDIPIDTLEFRKFNIPLIDFIFDLAYKSNIELVNFIGSMLQYKDKELLDRYTSKYNKEFAESALNKELLLYASNGDLENFRKCKEDGANILANDHIALKTAVSKKHLNIVKYIFENSDINSPENKIKLNMIMERAIGKNDDKMVEYFISKGLKTCISSWHLTEAINNNNPRLAELLMNNMIWLNGEKILDDIYACFAANKHAIYLSLLKELPNRIQKNAFNSYLQSIFNHIMRRTQYFTPATMIYFTPLLALNNNLLKEFKEKGVRLLNAAPIRYKDNIEKLEQYLKIDKEYLDSIKEKS